MDWDYIAILAPAEGNAGMNSTVLTDTLHAMGMHVRYRVDRLMLFGRDNLPTLSLPSGGILFGHLFTQDGIAVTDSTRFQGLADPIKVRQRILKTYWGSYLIIQPDARDAATFTITRAPSVAGNIPCVYSIKDGAGFLTSDISLGCLVLGYRKRINWDFVAHRLRYPDIKTQHTGLVDLVELLPGCSLRIAGSKVSVGQAWSPWDFVARAHRYRDLRDAANQVRTSVNAAVRAWADVDRSALLELSGGLDSSIVATSLRNRHVPAIFCNLVSDVPGIDERSYASQVAKELDVRLHTEYLGLDKARLDFPLTPDSIAPTMGPLQYAVDVTMDAAAACYGATAYYSGGGGDSVFCSLQTAAPGADAWKACGLGAAITAVRNLARLHQCTVWKACHLTLSKVRRPPRSPFHADPTFLAPDAGPVTPEPHPWFAAPSSALPGDRERIFDLAGNQLFEGQAARGHRRPLRFPLLSQPVIEACLRAPSWMWIADGKNRAVARAAFNDALPSDIVNRRSKGTYMSYLGTVYARNKRQIRDFLLSGRLTAQGVLDTHTISTFISKPLPPRDRTFLRLFELCMVENWVRHQP